MKVVHHACSPWTGCRVYVCMCARVRECVHVCVCKRVCVCAWACFLAFSEGEM